MDQRRSALLSAPDTRALSGARREIGVDRLVSLVATRSTNAGELRIQP
jgi:hypothetical protein